MDAVLIRKLCTELVEAVLAWSYLQFMFSAKKETGARILWYGLLYGINLVVFLLPQNVPFGNAISYFVINLILIRICYDSNAGSSAFHAAVLTVTMAVAEFAGILITGMFAGGVHVFQENETVHIIQVIVEKLLNLFLLTTEKNILRFCKKEEADIPAKAWILCVIPLISTITIIAFDVIIQEGRATTKEQGVLLIMAVLLIAITLLIELLYEYFSGKEQEYFQMKLRMMEEHAEAESYRMAYVAYEDQRILIHDFHNHISVLEGFLKENNIGEARKYIGRIEQSDGWRAVEQYSKNPYLNQLLMLCHAKCVEEGIRFHVDMKENGLAALQPEDIVALLGNLLENAFEAAKAASPGYIDFQIIEDTEERKEIFLSIENACGEPPRADGKGGFLSHKTDGDYHGIGMKSVGRVIRKYHAAILSHYDEDKKAFRITVRIPL